MRLKQLKNKKSITATGIIMTPKNLSEILGALLNEFNKANAANDLVSAQWNNIYSRNAQLSGFTPGKVKIITANISLPVAIAELGAPKVRDEGLNVKNIFDALNIQLPVPERRRIAGLLLEELQKGNNGKLADKRLPAKLASLSSKFKKEHPAVRELIHIAKIRELQKEFSKNPARESDCKCYFKSDDLQKFSSDNIVKFNFDITVA